MVNEIRADGSVQPKAGVSLRPIRKKAFHRALKRKESWAVMEQSMRDMSIALSKMFYPRINEYIKNEDRILTLSHLFESGV